MSVHYVSVAETSKLIRKALKESFPGVKFSVRSSSYSGGASVSVRWTDGPNDAQVSAVAKQFQGSYTDGSIDYKGSVFHMLDGKEVQFGADFVFTNREHSDAAIERAISRVYRMHAAQMRQAGIERPTVEDFRKGLLCRFYPCGMADSLEAKIRTTAAKTSDRMSAKNSATAGAIFVTRDDGYSRQVGSGFSAVSHETL